MISDSVITKILVFVSGAWLALQFTTVPGVGWCLVAIVLVGMCAWIRITLFVWLILGFAWTSGSILLSLNETLPKEHEGLDIPVEGIVADLPHAFRNGVRFNFEIQSVLGVRARSLPDLVRLSWYQSGLRIRAGQKWRLLIRLKRPHGTLNSGGFDYERWLFEKGIGATGYVRQSDQNRLLAHDVNWLSPQYWRQYLNDELSKRLHDKPHIGLVKALSIGYRDDIQPHQWAILRDTGTSHLVAISGLHVGLVAAGVFFLTRRFWTIVPFKRASPPKVAAVSSVLAAALYSALAGFSIPTQRALIMLCIVMGGVFLQRQLRPLHILATALVLVVIYDPLALMSPGFWLSFAAVALITFVVAGRVAGISYWRGMMRIQLAVAIGLAPLLLLFFQQVSLVSPLANAVAVPLVSLILVPACLLGDILLATVPSLGGPVLVISEKLIGYLWAFLANLSDPGFAQWRQLEPASWSIPLGCIGILLLLSPRGWPARWLGLILILPMLNFEPSRPERGHLWFTLLDVGQGLAAVAQTAKHVLVFDTGGRFSERFDMGTAVVLPFLHTNGYKSVDMMVVSHGDNDHIGGAEGIVTHVPVDRIYTSVPNQLPWSRRVDQCQSGQSWLWDNVRFTFLSPFKATHLSENDDSCVLKIEAPGGNILLTGDIEKGAEDLLRRRYGGELQSQILVVPHHGSNTSSTRKFLANVMPHYALVPAGYRNRFGFPTLEVLHRYENLGAEIFNTADSGAIRVVIDAKKGILPPERYRITHGKFWNARD